MGIVISVDAESPLAAEPHCYPVKVELECDDTSDMFCRGIATFTNQDGYIGANADAMKAGWLERRTPDGRLWICPRCSGKEIG